MLHENCEPNLFTGGSHFGCFARMSAESGQDDEYYHEKLDVFPEGKYLLSSCNEEVPREDAGAGWQTLPVLSFAVPVDDTDHPSSVIPEDWLSPVRTKTDRKRKRPAFRYSSEVHSDNEADVRTIASPPGHDELGLEQLSRKVSVGSSTDRPKGLNDLSIPHFPLPPVSHPLPSESPLLNPRSIQRDEVTKEGLPALDVSQWPFRWGTQSAIGSRNEAGTTPSAGLFAERERTTSFGGASEISDPPGVAVRVASATTALTSSARGDFQEYESASVASVSGCASSETDEPFPTTNGAKFQRRVSALLGDFSDASNTRELGRMLFGSQKRSSATRSNSRGSLEEMNSASNSKENRARYGGLSASHASFFAVMISTLNILGFLVIAPSLVLGTWYLAEFFGAGRARTLNFLAYFAPVTSICVALSPIPSIVKAYISGKANDLPISLFYATAITALASVDYGRKIWNLPLMVTNTVGLCCQLTWLSCHYAISTRYGEGRIARRRGWRRFLLQLAGGSLFVYYACTLLSTGAAGVLVIILNIVLFSTPLTEVATVVKSGCADRMPLPIVSMMVLQNAVWTLYGHLLNSTVIFIPSVVCLEIVVFQLMVLVATIRHSSTPFDILVLKFLLSRDATRVAVQPTRQNLELKEVPFRLPATSKRSRSASSLSVPVVV